MSTSIISDILSGMKGVNDLSSKRISVLIAALLLLCISLSIYLLWPKSPKAIARIFSNGTFVQEVDLRKDTEFVIQSGNGANTICVRDGYISVSEASCPDKVCMSFGWCNSGMPIVCLPNGLIIEFANGEVYDGMTG